MNLLDELDKIHGVIVDCCKTCDCIEIVDDFIPSFNGRYTSRMGHYRGKRFGTKFLTFSEKLWPKATTDERRNTIVHEVCHGISHYLYDVVDHGGRWSQLMVRCGEKPTRTHHVDNSEYKRKRPRVVFECSCIDNCTLGPTQAKRVKQGHIYTCVKCLKRIDLGTKVIGKKV